MWEKWEGKVRKYRERSDLWKKGGKWEEKRLDLGGGWGGRVGGWVGWGFGGWGFGGFGVWGVGGLGGGGFWGGWGVRGWVVGVGVWVVVGWGVVCVGWWVGAGLVCRASSPPTWHLYSPAELGWV